MTGHGEGHGVDPTPDSAHSDHQLTRRHRADRDGVLPDLAHIEPYDPDGACVRDLGLHCTGDTSSHPLESFELVPLDPTITGRTGGVVRAAPPVIDQEPRVGSVRVAQLTDPVEFPVFPVFPVLPDEFPVLPELPELPEELPVLPVLPEPPDGSPVVL